MDGLTILAAWTGAVTGIGSLVVQYVLHRKSGAVVRLRVMPAYTKDGQLATVWLEFVNKGREDVQLVKAGASHVKHVRRWRRNVMDWSPRWLRRLLVRTKFMPGQIHRIGALGAGGWPQRLPAGTTKRYDVPVFTGPGAKPAEWLHDTDYLYPYARLGNGKLLRRRKVSTRV